MLLLLACAPKIPECGPDQHVTAAGECADDPQIPGAEDLPECELLDFDDRIDVYSGCADGACAGDTYETISAVLGEEGTCEEISNVAFCSWSVGIDANFTDVDGDAVPDEGATADGLFLYEDYTGSSEQGLGLGISLGCWIDVYGYTSDVEYEGEQITELWWDSIGLFVHDRDLDGLADMVSLFGM